MEEHRFLNLSKIRKLSSIAVLDQEMVAIIEYASYIKHRFVKGILNIFKTLLCRRDGKEVCN